MQILITILLVAPILALLVWVLSRSAMGSRRATRRGTLALLEGVLNGRASQQAWDLFVGYPIGHDEALEAIRRRCVVLQEGDADNPPAGEGIGDFIFNREGRERLAPIVADLKRLIDAEPFQRSF